MTGAEAKPFQSLRVTVTRSMDDHTGSLPLSQRGDAPKASRQQAGAIRSETVGLIGRARADLARETAKNPSLAQDLEHRVFGYFDSLAAMGAKAKTAQNEPAAAAPPAPTPA